MSYSFPKKQVATPTTGQTVTIANQDDDIRLLLNPAGTLLALTIVFPSAPRDGQMVTICSTQILTGLTLTSGGTILGALTTIAAINGYASYVYDLAGNTWYRVG
jgi:hypothetical protein